MVLLARVGATIAAIVLLAGCTDADWEHALTFGGAPPEERSPPTRALAVTPAIPEPNPSYAFCQGVVADDVAHSEFDAATTKRMAEASYRQCVAVFGDASPR